MDEDVPLYTECPVSGIICYALYLSRVFGLAPLKFENVHNGKRIHVSRIYRFYSQAMVIIVISLSMTGLIADLTINKAHSLRTNTNAGLFLWIADLAVADTVALTCAYTGINRMQQLIVCMAKLKIVNKEISNYYKMPISDNKKIWLLICSLIVIGFFVIFTEYIIFLMDVAKTNGNDLVLQLLILAQKFLEDFFDRYLVILWTSSLYIGHSILSYVLKTFVVQFSLITMSVLPSFQAVHRCLQKIYKDTLPQGLFTQGNTYKTKTYKLFHRVKDSTPINKIKDERCDLATTFDRLPLLYCELCDIVRRINDCNGFILVMVFLSFLLHLVITLYNLITGLITKHAIADYDNAPLQLSWALYHFISLLLVVEPCHRTHEQMKLIKVLVNKMRHYSLRDDFALACKLKTFHRHIMLNQITYSPMQLFVISRALVAVIMGSITTYLVIVIQL